MTSDRPTLPENADDGLDEEDRTMIAALKHHLRSEDEWGDEENQQFVMALLRYQGVDPDDVVLIEDSTAAYGYRPMLKSEYHAEREYKAKFEESLSKALRHKLDVPASEVEDLDGLPELSDMFIDETRAYYADHEGADADEEAE